MKTKRISEDAYYYALGVLPPIFLEDGSFIVPEPVDFGLYHRYYVKNGRYYETLYRNNKIALGSLRTRVNIRTCIKRLQIMEMNGFKGVKDET